jgi:hypothetical protein
MAVCQTNRYRGLAVLVRSYSSGLIRIALCQGHLGSSHIKALRQTAARGTTMVSSGCKRISSGEPMGGRLRLPS